MNSFHKIAVIYVASLAPLLAATPQTVGFDDLVPGSLPGHDATYEGPIPNGYAGFQWNNFWVLDTVLDPTTSGYQNAVVSPNNVAFNVFGSPSLISDGVFDLNSAYLTAAWNDGLHVEVRGYSGGTLLYDNTYTLSTLERTFITFDYYGVDQVQFISSGGTPHGYSGAGTQFALDNLTMTVPEPCALTLAGLAATLRALRRRT